MMGLTGRSSWPCATWERVAATGWRRGSVPAAPAFSSGCVSLESRGSVIRQAIRHGVGRPRHLYDVTAEAQRSLPANYGGLATTLLESIAELGGDQLVDAVFQARRRLLAERIRARITAALGRPPPSPHASGSWPSSRTSRAISAAPRHSTGSMGPLELREANCAILGAVAGHPAACRAEVQLFEEVLDARVTRISHIAAGDRSCTYRIEPREA